MRRPGHAVVVADLALFVALGGSSYAALTITGGNVKNSSLTGGLTGLTGPAGLSGVEIVENMSLSNSSSPKTVVTECPEGKRIIGSGVDIAGGKTGADPNVLTDVVIDQLQPQETQVVAEAYEEEATADSWQLFVDAICAKVSGG
jgi:hypothetical protein